MNTHEVGQWPDAVLFDCDGVLVDSETPTIEILVEWARRRLALPNPLAQGFADRCRGKPTHALSAEVEVREARVGLRELEELDLLVDATVRIRASIMPGTASAIVAIPSPIAIVSNAAGDWLSDVVARAGLQASFGRNLFSSHAFCRPKPAPDIYLHAMDSLFVAPNRCIAIEDSLPGVAAAVTAGIPTLAFVYGGRAAERAEQLLDGGACGVVNGMASLSGQILELSRKQSR